MAWLFFMAVSKLFPSQIVAGNWTLKSVRVVLGSGIIEVAPRKLSFLNTNLLRTLHDSCQTSSILNADTLLEHKIISVFSIKPYDDITFLYLDNFLVDSEPEYT